MEDFIGIITKVVEWLLIQGPLGFTTLIALTIGGLNWWDNRKLRQKYDDIQEKRIEEVRVITTLAEKFTTSMEFAMSLLHKKVS